ncbi:MAG: hypothetical protein HUU55_22560, partial [Myxococcales bacterium]|nr:hypothetical protein [Myxococcales bacterium]
YGMFRELDSPDDIHDYHQYDEYAYIIREYETIQRAYYHSDGVVLLSEIHYNYTSKSSDLALVDGSTSQISLPHVERPKHSVYFQYHHRPIEESISAAIMHSGHADMTPSSLVDRLRVIGVVENDFDTSLAPVPGTSSPHEAFQTGVAAFILAYSEATSGATRSFLESVQQCEIAELHWPETTKQSRDGYATGDVIYRHSDTYLHLMPKVGACLPRTQFEYQSGGIGLDTPYTLQSGIEVESPEHMDDAFWFTLDMNGDNLDDLIFRHKDGWVQSLSEIGAPGLLTAPTSLGHHLEGDVTAIPTDFDLDRFGDLIVTTGFDEVNILRGTGETLEEGATISLPGQAAYVATGDMDGDSRQDIVTCEVVTIAGEPETQIHSWGWYRNAGGLYESRQLMYAPTTDLEEVCVIGGSRIMDAFVVDADQDGFDEVVLIAKLPESGDLVRKSVILHAHRAGGAGITSNSFTEIYKWHEDHHLRTFAPDWNGDGMPDAMMLPNIEGNYSNALLALGTWKNTTAMGFTQFVQKSGGVGGGDSEYGIDNLLLMDLNDDGRSELFARGVDAEGSWFMVGFRTALDRRIQNPCNPKETSVSQLVDPWELDDSSFCPLETTLNAVGTTEVESGPLNGVTNWDGEWRRLRTGDFDGDGRLDLLVVDGSTGTWTLYPRKKTEHAEVVDPIPPGLLRQVRDGYGSVLKIDYGMHNHVALLAAKDVVECDFPLHCGLEKRPVVKRTRQDLMPPVEYAFGTFVRDQRDGSPLGFDSMRITRHRDEVGADPEIIWRYYDVSTWDNLVDDFLFAGRLLREVKLPGMSPNSENVTIVDTHYTPEMRATGGVRAKNSLVSPDIVANYFVSDTHVEIHEYFSAMTLTDPDKLDNATPVRTTVVETEVNLFALPQTVTTTQGGRQHVLSIEYLGLNEALWLVDRPIQIVEQEFTEFGNATRTREFQYLPGQIDPWNEVIEPGNPELQREIETVRDQWGTPTTIITKDGVPAVVRQESVVMDNEGLYPVSRQNALGHVSTESWDSRFGAQLSIFDANGLGMTRNVDGFGRLVKETPKRIDNTPLGAAKETVYERTLGGNFETPSPLRVHQISQTGAERWTIYTLRGLVAETRWLGPDGIVRKQRRLFDDEDRLIKVYDPIKEGELWGTFWEVNYDTMNRRRSSMGPDGNVHESKYKINEIIDIDPKGNQRTLERDQAGRLVRVRDDVGTVTCFRWGPFSTLHSVGRDCAPNGSAESQIQYVFDAWGNKRSMFDPDGEGIRLYDVLPSGHVWRETDSEGNVQIFEYDAAFRLTGIESPEGTTTFVYDNQLLGYLDGSVSPDGVLREWVLNDLGRVVEHRQTIGAQLLQIGMSHDVFGRLDRITFPLINGVQRKMEMMYGGFGHWTGVRDPNSATTWWSAGTADSQGRIRHLKLGNGLWSGQKFDSMGRLSNTFVVKPSGAQVVAGEIVNINAALDVLVHGELGYDNNGNVKERLDHVQSVEELFSYDNLDRLIATQTSHMVAAISTTREVDYDVTSGFEWRSDIGTIVSNKAGRVQVAGPRRYFYDYNGRATDIVQEGLGGGLATNPLPISLTYNVLGQVTEMTYNGGSLSVLYDADNQVVRTTTGGVTKTSLAGLYERETTGGLSGDTLHRFFIPGPNGVVAEIHDQWTPALVLKGQPPQPAVLTTDTRYVHNDYLGSPVLVTDEGGTPLQEMSWGSWGEQRGSSWLQAAPFTDNLDLSMGYTGHPMTRPAGMLHMGGRLYDAWLGRFTGPDPLVAFPLKSSSHNRYGYVESSPLNYVDPSGFDPDPVPSVWDEYPPDEPGPPPQGHIGVSGGTYVSSAQCGGGFGACARRFGRMLKRLFQHIGGDRGNGGGAPGEEGSTLSPGLAGKGQPLDLGEYGALPSGAPEVSTTATAELPRVVGKSLGQQMTPERRFQGQKMAKVHNQIVRSIEKGDRWAGGRPITARELYHRAREEREEIYYPIRQMMGSGSTQTPVVNADFAADSLAGAGAAAAANAITGNPTTVAGWLGFAIKGPASTPVAPGPAFLYAVVAGATWKASTWGVALLKAWGDAAAARQPGNAAYCRGISQCRSIFKGWDEFEAEGEHIPTSRELGYNHYWHGNSYMGGRFVY